VVWYARRHERQRRKVSLHHVVPRSRAGIGQNDAQVERVQGGRVDTPAGGRQLSEGKRKGGVREPKPKWDGGTTLEVPVRPSLTMLHIVI
jgi:hypothetical protein